MAIKAIRTELGLSRRAFAERGDGLGAKTVQRLEEGTIDPWPQTLLKFDKAAGKPAGWSDAVIEGKIMYPDEPDPSGQDDPEPLSPDWWLTLRRALTAKMFAEVSELVHLGQKAAAEGDQSADGA